MADTLSIAFTNLASPMVLFFALGFLAALARSELSVPEAVGKGLALYLMLAIGFKGGVSVAEAGLSTQLLVTSLAGIALGFAIPVLAHTLLRLTTDLDHATRAAVAAHYGSISVVTFVAATEVVKAMGLVFDGYMVAVMALMETPAIIAGLLLARVSTPAGEGDAAARHETAHETPWGTLAREVFLNGSVVLLLGAFFIGIITGPKGMVAIGPFVDAPFKGILCLFLLDMGLLAARRLRESAGLTLPLAAFGIYMPLIAASLGVVTGTLIGLDVGSVALLTVLSASASYIAVPAAMRMALPEANAAIYLTLSMAITFPFNLVIGIPLYAAVAQMLAG
ncbi:sodium-dependent bicarbonate transport family permease [Pyruvatibacter mobilis]|uniref:Sodium-dependent bicarbonate transport family permease n=1 Tax=Pyruvatibacter mobilis TaxID=1712261 RepID=A0A845QA15_9HYPH|nr:sodium-dependent bicarbonate transport family permease [Pyruvatibacter mobilis]NBG95334.1 sodium-dependent bicarbonate transport family permease [Pyruvatibacter mobilis]QJD75571.1 sodium-dependent bicarbonate transport family permease [Pyruvatibacter mobilis]GGD16714.1 sodium-dependent bicarbonate transport family permease [Pyruvatibacter mobilis]